MINLFHGTIVAHHGRTHHPDIMFGCWRIALNGVQFFVGKFSLTVHWPYWFYESYWLNRE